jgi:uncharacterized iron-regulated protein
MIPVLLALIPLLQSPPAPPPPPSVAPREYVPERVYDTQRKTFTDFESMLADLVRADVVFVGEQHNDPNTHALELAMLEGLLRRHAALAVGLEMFERDVQGAIDEYVRGRSTEEQFLAASRPWPRYATDYRLIVELAKTHHLAVIASNVPRRIATDVSKNGMSIIEGLRDDRGLAARDLQCAMRGDYYNRFIEQMGGHPPAGDPKANDTQANDTQAKNDRFYLAQCVKDETMAESVAEAFRNAPEPRATIVHFNGSFHTDYGDGTAERTRRRLPGRRVAVISMIPVDDIDTIAPDDDDLKQADYLVFTVGKKK